MARQVGSPGARDRGGGVGRWGYSHVSATWVCAAVRDMVFKQFSLRYEIEMRD